MDSWLSTFSSIARCSCITHINNGTMGPVPALDDDADVCKNVRMVEVKILSSAKSKTKTRRILLVDDEPDVAVTIEIVLEESGFFQVDLFRDGATALSIFKPGVYDLAILDIKMPRMDGFELCRKIRDIDNKIKVCFLTAADRENYRETDSDVINDLGTDCFIAKPVNNEDIVQRLKLLLSM